LSRVYGKLLLYFVDYSHLAVTMGSPLIMYLIIVAYGFLTFVSPVTGLSRIADNNVYGTYNLDNHFSAVRHGTYVLSLLIPDVTKTTCQSSSDVDFINLCFHTLLLLSGDIAMNPGPAKLRQTKDPCAVCQRGVRSGIECEVCTKWFHPTCVGMSKMFFSNILKTY